MRKPDSSLKHEPVARKQIALFHGVLRTTRAWTWPAVQCVRSHCDWQPDPELQLSPLGLFHSSVPPPLLHRPHQRTPLSASLPCHGKSTQTPGPHVRDFLGKCFEWKPTLLPSRPPPFNQPWSKQAYVGKMFSYLMSFLRQRSFICETQTIWQLLGAVGTQ